MQGFKLSSALRIILAAVVMMTSCRENAGGGPPEEPTAESPEETALREVSSRAEGAPLFEKVPTGHSGVSLVNRLQEDHPMARLYFSGFACGAVVMADLNGDGRQDLFFTRGAGPNALYLQGEEPWQFEEVSDAAGITGGDRWAGGALAVDLDQDRDLDLVVANYEAPPHLFINRGDGTFVDRAGECGLTSREPLLMPTVCDYDRDGDPDLFFVANQVYPENGRPVVPPVERGPDGKLRIKPESARSFRLKQTPEGRMVVDDTGRPDLLLRNDRRPGRNLPFFTDVTEEAGLALPGFGLSATWFDANGDDWPDLHVGNDFSDPDRLYLNRGDGTFVDRAAGAFPTCCWFSMGADACDLDGDGLDDLFCADMAFTTHYKQKVGMGQMGARQALLQSITPLQLMRNHLFLNTGSGRFQEAAQMAGLGKTDWTWAVRFADFDLDGKSDLFVTNGACRSFNHSDLPGATPERLVGRNKWDLWKNTPPRPETNLAFRNLGEAKFEEVSSAWGLDETGVSHGLACGDLDGDGDLDLVVTHVDQTVSLYRNQSSRPRLVLDLEAPVVEGARVELIAPGNPRQIRRVRTAGGYHTTATPSLSFAAGGSAHASITWPDGEVQKIRGLEPGKRYRIRKTSRPKMPQKKEQPLFGEPRMLAGVAHREALFDDFAKQPLLPHKLSQLGPASAWADIDGDGDRDHFLGGACGRPGTLFRNENGQLVPIPTEALERDRECEDAAAAFFDFDRDGDVDLYVASGSYENDRQSEALRDRLYRNDGQGGFTRADLLPEDLRDVGSVVRPGDLDGDGTPEIFVGSRVIPGEYPLASASRLLVWQDGQYREVGPERAPGLSSAGMVTDAVWADVDGDGQPDLITVGEWSPPGLYLNRGGRLVEHTREAGLRDLQGWWTRIKAGDLDGDGDQDLVVGNFGLNTKYHASPEKPTLLYYGDFQGSGIKRLVEAEYERNTLFPVRGKSCSTAAMPALASKFRSYHDFALAELSEIYPLDRGRKFECHILASGILRNDGKGHFTFQPLPHRAQIAPVQGIVLTDVTGDRFPDLLLAQNFYNPQFETGPYSGGTGILLTNDGTGGFAPVHPTLSGILLPGDPRNLHLIDLDGDSQKDLICPLNNGPSLWQKRQRSTLPATQ